MIVAKAIETRWLILCDKTYFMGLHVQLLVLLCKLKKTLFCCSSLLMCRSLFLHLTGPWNPLEMPLILWTLMKIVCFQTS